ncbi:MAG: hypothetical protein ABSA17_01235 [Rhabdochlamydiaceae bacterium]|jgi:hypothetical protein
MVSKVTSITPKQIYAEFNKLPKEVKVALAILTTLATVYVAVRLIQRAWTAGPVEKPKATIDDLVEIARLLEGREVVEIPDDVIAKGSIDPKEKDQIVSDILVRHAAFSNVKKFIPICKGKDSSERPFYYFAFKKENDTKVLGIIISTVHVNGISELLIEKLGEFEVGNDPTAFLQGLINGTNAQYKLIEASAPDKSQANDPNKVKRSEFPEELQAIIPEEIDVFYKLEEHEKRNDPIDNENKFVALAKFCETNEDGKSAFIVGRDPWSLPFIHLRCQTKEDKALGEYFIYCINGHTWFMDKKPFDAEAARLMTSIVQGTHQTIELLPGNIV